MPVTLKDIAERVGKSVPTVSRALAGYQDISAETRREVQRVAAEMGYSPSTLAQRLRKKRSDTIGLILPTFGPRFIDPFISEFIAGICTYASPAGYDLLVSTHVPGEQEMKAYRNIVQSRRVDGFIIVRTRQKDERIEYLHKAGFPFVSFGRTESLVDFPFTDEDSVQGMHQLASHLYDLGHRRIACITAPLYLMFARHRLDGLREGLQQLGLELDPLLVREGDLTLSGGYRQAKELLELDEAPTAIVACNDMMAFGAMSAAQDAGLEVGRDISITGFDNLPMAEHTHPALTTLHQPIYQIGSRVAQMLIEIILGKSTGVEQVVLQPSLIVRSSSGLTPLEPRR